MYLLLAGGTVGVARRVARGRISYGDRENRVASRAWERRISSLGRKATRITKVREVRSGGKK
jgi:hypothetical protein